MEYLYQIEDVHNRELMRIRNGCITPYDMIREETFGLYAHFYQSFSMCAFAIIVNFKDQS